MRKTTVYLDEETAVALRRIARKHGRSQAEMIREALQQYTLHFGRSRPKSLGIGRSGRRNISEQAEEILRKAVRKQ